MEIWDLYTKYRNKTGKEHIRGAQIPEGYYHLVVHVWIRNKKGAYLISQRAANRPTFPLMWECVGGSVLKGEESVNGAIREAKEEVGIDLEPSQGKKIFTKIRKSFQDMMDVWLFEYDGEIQMEKATTDEVAICKWMSVDDIKKLHDSGKLVYTLDYFFYAFNDEIPDYSHVIGKTVSVKVDRPIGSQHPGHPDMKYPVNYGHVEGVMTADGADQNVYILGTDEPLHEFEGKVIKVFHRFNDKEDQWIVSANGADIPEDNILGDIAFQEQLFYGKLYG